MDDRVKNWHVPLAQGQRILGEAYAELREFGLKQDDIPLLVKLLENPDYDYLPGFDIFHGGTNLEQHDYIHIVLGRGVQAIDEAFVLGFTAGSTNRVTSSEESLYTFFAKHLFPKQYRFSDQEIHVYKDAVRLGFISDCHALDKIDFTQLAHLSINQVREHIGLEQTLLAAYYQIEKKRYPNSFASQRNI
jgi:hypothetical protein